MKIVKQIYRVVYYTFVIVFLLLIILFTITIESAPGDFSTKIVQSGSMEPRLPVGSLVFISPQESYQAGDIITFGEDTQLKIPTTHRIVAVKEEAGEITYTTKGDANDNIDQRPIERKEVIGKVLFNIPYIGYLIDFARTPIGFILLVILPAVIVFFEEVVILVKEIFSGRSKKRKEVKKEKEKASEGENKSESENLTENTDT